MPQKHMNNSERTSQNIVEVIDVLFSLYSVVRSKLCGATRLTLIRQASAVIAPVLLRFVGHLGIGSPEYTSTSVST
jgi:hypothetical protein